jgi:DNA-binding MarR family transcriptional regulator
MNGGFDIQTLATGQIYTGPYLPRDVFVALFRAASAFDAAMMPVFREFGITPQQYNVLRILYCRGGEDGLPMLTCAERLVDRTPDITRLVDRMEAAGFVERHRSAKDRRQVFVRLATKGRELLGQMERPVLEAHRRHMAHLTGEEQQQLVDLLYRAAGHGAATTPCEEAAESLAGTTDGYCPQREAEETARTGLAGPGVTETPTFTI